MLKNDPEFLNKIMTSDESWCFAYNPESKWQSATWVSPNLPKHKEISLQKLCFKMMLVAFFHSRGLIHEDFVSSDKTINAEYYEGVMDRLLKRIAHVCPDFHTSNDWFLLRDNAPAHNTASIHQFLAKESNSSSKPPPSILYSSYLAPVDYFFKIKIKRTSIWWCTHYSKKCKGTSTLCHGHTAAKCGKAM